MDLPPLIFALLHMAFFLLFDRKEKQVIVSGFEHALNNYS